MNSYPSRILRFALVVIFAVQPLLIPVVATPDSSLVSTAVASTLEADTLEQTYGEYMDDSDVGSSSYGLPDDYEPPPIAPPDTPVWINLSLSKRLISPSETAQLSINVVPVYSLAPAPVQLALELPEGLEVVGGGESQWELPPLADGDKHDWTVSLGVSKAALDSLPAAYEVTVRASASDHKDEAVSLIMGVITEENNDVSASLQGRTQAVVKPNHGTVLMDRETDGKANMAILATDKSAPAGATFEQELLYEWHPPSATKVNAETVISGTTSAMGNATYLPWVASDSLSILSAKEASKPPMDGGVRVYKKWRLQASHDDKSIKKFESPLLMIVDAQDIIDMGIDPNHLLLWTRPNAGYSWSEVRTEYVEEQQIWLATLTHFSEILLGEGITAGYYQIPSMQSTHTDLYSGSASYSIPLRAPDGVGGMNPNLSLSYSSGTVDNVYINTKDLRMSQASVVGYGWDIGGLGYIARVDPHEEYIDDYFTLVIDGQRVDIEGENSTWGMTPHLFADIQHDASSASETWVITTTNGYRYTYGGIMQSSVWPDTITYRDENVSRRLDREDNTIVRLIDKWMLAKVEDPQGNTITYHYEAERNATQPECDGHTSNTNYQWFTGAVHLTSVTWSGNSDLSLDEKLKMTFSYTSRSDTTLDASQAWCRQVRISQRRLNEVTVQAKVDGSWHTIRSYALSGNYNPENVGLKHFLLQSVSEKGKNGGTLVTQNFTYHDYKNHDNNDSNNNIRLESASNGYGGSIEYKYVKHDFDYTHANIRNRTGEPWPVAHSWLDDGYGGIVQHKYEYGNNRAAEYNEVFEWIGFDVATEGVFEKTTSKIPSTTTREDYVWYSESWFHTGTVDIEDHRKGKPYKTTVFNQRTSIPGGLRQYSQTEYTWSDIDTSTPDFARHWIRLDVTNEWTAGSGLLTEYYYHELRQSGEQYGNLTDLLEKGTTDANQTLGEWSNSVNETAGCEPLLIMRASTIDYYPDTTDPNSPYIKSLPARVRVYIDDNDDGTLDICTSETRTIYANLADADQNRGGNYNDSPMSNLVVKTQQAVNHCSDSATINPYDQNWLETRASYDVYGNQTAVRTLGADPNEFSIAETTYDSTYHLFPVSMRQAQNNEYTITAKYYGVNGPSEVPITSDSAHWGAMAEYCGIDDICSRQKYDAFGRTKYRWDHIPEGTSWSAGIMDPRYAELEWKYYMPGGIADRTTYTITEHAKPRCYGNFVRKHYNGLGQLVAETTPDDVWSIADAYCGTSSNTGSENIIYYAYNALGNQTHLSRIHPLDQSRITSVSFSSPEWSTIQHTMTEYDALGRPTVTTAPNGEQTNYEYHGRINRIVDPGRGAETAKMLRWFEMDWAGNIEWVRSAVWNSSTNRWQTDARINIQNDVKGNPVRVQFQDGREITSYQYDIAGRMTSMDDMSLGHWRYSYDRLGRMERQTDACGNKTEMVYDSLDRVTLQEFKRGQQCLSSTDPYTYTVSYQYDNVSTGAYGDFNGKGKPTSIIYSDNSFRKDFYYTSRGLPEKEVVKYSVSGPEYRTQTLYDEWLRPQSVRYPDNERAGVKFNSRGLPYELYLLNSGTTQTIVSGVDYDERGALLQLHYPEPNLWRQQTYHWGSSAGNGNGRLAQIRVGTTQGAANILNLTYTYDNFGNVGNIHESYNGSTPLTPNEFRYEDHNRILLGYNRWYLWDPYGRLERFEAQNYGYDESAGANRNAIKSVEGEVQYSYNANGNMTGRYIGEDDYRGIKELQLSWNVQNRLHSALDVSSNITTTYLYDPNGIRVKKTVGSEDHYYPNRYYEMHNGAKRKYYYMGDMLIAVRERPGELTYVHSDHLGSTVGTTTSTGTETFTYRAFGDSRSGTSPTTERQYTGQIQDDNQLMYYNARYYDKHLGAFISPDPSIPDPTDIASYNRYLYANGNPIKYNDPSGYQTDDTTRMQNDMGIGGGTYAYEPILTDHQLAMVQSASEQWGIPWQVMAAVLESEIALDTNYKDYFENYAILCFPPSALLRKDPGPGVGNVHVSTARAVSVYMDENYPDSMQLDMHGMPKIILAYYLVHQKININAATADVRMLADYRFGSDGNLNSTDKSSLDDWTFADAVSMWHGYRYGVPDIGAKNGSGFADVISFQDRGNTVTGMLSSGGYAGEGAYGSVSNSLPIFRYYYYLK